MERFTICGLRSFVDYVNETVPKIKGSISRYNQRTVAILSFLKVTAANMAQQPKTRI